MILTGLLTIGVYAVGCTQEEVVEPRQVEIIETEPIKYLTNYQLSLLYSLKDDKKKPDVIDLTQSEAWLLMLVSRAEGGDTLDGQLWTMRTLLNRVESDNPDFQKVNTIGEVIYQTGQFEVVSSGSYRYADLNVNSHLALAMVESGWNETSGSLWFESSSNTDNSWHKRNLTFIKEVEGQLYYK